MTKEDTKGNTPVREVVEKKVTKKKVTKKKATTTQVGETGEKVVKKTPKPRKPKKMKDAPKSTPTEEVLDKVERILVLMDQAEQAFQGFIRVYSATMTELDEVSKDLVCPDEDKLRYAQLIAVAEREMLLRSHDFTPECVKLGLMPELAVVEAVPTKPTSTGLSFKKNKKRKRK